MAAGSELNTNTPPVASTRRRRHSMVGSIPAAQQELLGPSSSGTGSNLDPAGAAAVPPPPSPPKAGKVGLMLGSLNPEQIRKLHGNVFSTGSAASTESTSAGDSSLLDLVTRHSSITMSQHHLQQQQQQALLLAQMERKPAEAGGVMLDTDVPHHTLRRSTADTAQTTPESNSPLMRAKTSDDATLSAKESARTSKEAATGVVDAMQRLHGAADAAPISPACAHTATVSPTRNRRGSLTMSQQQELLLAQLSSYRAAAAATGAATKEADEAAPYASTPATRLQRRSKSLDPPPATGMHSAAPGPVSTAAPRESDVLEQYARSLGLKPARRSRSLDPPPKVQFETPSAKASAEPGRSFLSKLSTGWGLLSGNSQQQKQQQPVQQQQKVHTASALAAIGGSTTSDSSSRIAAVAARPGAAGAIHTGLHKAPEAPLQKSKSTPTPVIERKGSEAPVKDFHRCQTQQVTRADPDDDSPCSSAESSADGGTMGSQAVGLLVQGNQSYKFQYFVPPIELIDKHARERAADADCTDYAKLMDTKHR